MSGRIKTMKNYNSILEKINSEYAIPSALLLAIADVETDFNPRYRSLSGKRGIMGMLPYVARQNLPGTPYEHLYDSDLEDSEVAFRIGANFLRKLFSMLDDPNMSDVVRMYGNVNLSGANYVELVMKKFLTYSQSSSTPQDISPDELARRYA